MISEEGNSNNQSSEDNRIEEEFPVIGAEDIIQATTPELTQLDNH